MAIVGESNKFSSPEIIGIVNRDNFAGLESAHSDSVLWSELALCDWAELRADGFEPDTLKERMHLIRRRYWENLGRNPNLLLTLRLERDGGNWPDQQSEARIDLWNRLLDGEDAGELFQWMDVELETLPGLSRRIRDRIKSRGINILCSHHNPDHGYGLMELRQMTLEMEGLHPEGLKFAIMAQNLDQLFCVFDLAKFLAPRGRPSCVISMGEIGRASRVISPLLGAVLTYAFIGDFPVASGQLGASRLKSIFQKLMNEYRGDLSNHKIHEATLDLLDRNDLAV